MFGITLRQVRAFLLAAESGGLSAAAKTLRLTQPAVSQQVRELEAQLQVRLLERLGRHMTPTAAGRALIGPARQLLAAVDELDRIVAPYRTGAAGRLRLGTGATACIYFLPEPLRRTKASLPGIDITVITGNTHDVLRAVEDGSLDVGLVSASVDQPPSAFEVEPLFTEALDAIFPGEMEACLPAIVGPAEVLASPLILYETGGVTRRLIGDWFAAAGLAVAPSMELGSIEAIKAQVAAGFGCSIVPRLAVSAAGGITVRPLHPAITRHVSLVLRPDKVLDIGLRTLFGELRSAVERMPALCRL